MLPTTLKVADPPTTKGAAAGGAPTHNDREEARGTVVSGREIEQIIITGEGSEVLAVISDSEIIEKEGIAVALQTSA